MNRTHRTIIVIAVFAILTLSVTLPSFASREGRRNTALVLTGAALYSALQRDRAPSALLGLGALAAWDRVGHHRYYRHREYVYYPGYYYYPDYRYYPRDYDRDDYYRYHPREFRDFRRDEHRPRGRAFGWYRNHEGRDSGHSRGDRGRGSNRRGERD